MPYVSIPKDLAKIKSKLVFNMSKRQLICFGAAAVIGVPTYIFTRGAIGGSASALLMIALMLPCFFLAMYEKDGMPAEIVIRNYIRTCILWPGKRIYKTENLYDIITKEGKYAIQNKTAAKAPVSKRKTGKGKPR